MGWEWEMNGRWMGDGWMDGGVIFVFCFYHLFFLVFGSTTDDDRRVRRHRLPIQKSVLFSIRTNSKSSMKEHSRRTNAFGRP